MLATLETDTSSWGTHSAGQDQTHQVTAHLSALALPAPPCPRRGGEAGCQRSLHGPGGSDRWSLALTSHMGWQKNAR